MSVSEPVAAPVLPAAAPPPPTDFAAPEWQLVGALIVGAGVAVADAAEQTGLEAGDFADPCAAELFAALLPAKPLTSGDALMELERAGLYGDGSEQYSLGMILSIARTCRCAKPETLRAHAEQIRARAVHLRSRDIYVSLDMALPESGEWVPFREIRRELVDGDGFLASSLAMLLRWALGQGEVEMRRDAKTGKSEWRRRRRTVRSERGGA